MIEAEEVMIEDADMYLLLVAELDRKEKQYSKLIIINEICKVCISYLVLFAKATSYFFGTVRFGVG